ncbi:MAG: sulfatase [Verrucomicrobiales bacterium]
MKFLLTWIAIAAACAANAADRPNVLFIITDDWGFGDAGAYGSKWITTPSFDKIAGQGLRFDNAYTPNAKCAPSRAAILTGRNPWQLKEAGNHAGFFPLEFKVYPEVLAEHGYFTGITGKGWAPGIARDAAGKPRLLTGQPFQKRKAPAPTTGIDQNDYTANFVDFLDAAPKDGPWCFWMGIHEPHRDYEYGSGVAKGGKQLTDIDRVPVYWPDNDTVRNDMLDYALEVEHLDRHLGRIVAELEKRGQLENTLLIVTSDNGRPFPREKGNLYEAANHLPFAVMWKKGIKDSGRVVKDYISFIDIAPTILEAAGIPWEKSGMASTPGKSLSDIFRSGKTDGIQSGRDHLILGQERHDVGRPKDQGYPIRSILKDGWLYSRNFAPDRWPAGNPETGYLNTDGGATKTEILNANRAQPGNLHWLLCFGKRPSEELFDIRKDPDCLTNLAASPGHGERRAALETTLLAKLREQEDPRVSGQGDIFDNYPYAGAETGLYERHQRGEKVKTGWVNPNDYEPGPLDDTGKPK